MILLLTILSCSIGPEKCPVKAGVIGSENLEAKVQKRGEYLKETSPKAFARLVAPFRSCPPSPSPLASISIHFRPPLLPLSPLPPFPRNRIVFRFRPPFLPQKRDLPPPLALPLPQSKPPSTGQKITLSKHPHSQRVYKGSNFLIYGNKFSCGRKFFAVRKAQNFPSKAGKFSYVRKFSSVRTKILHLALSGHSLRARRDDEPYKRRMPQRPSDH